MIVGTRESVLVAADLSSSNEGLEALAEAFGEVVQVTSAEQTLEACASSEADLVLLALPSTGWGGLETLAALKREPATRDVPVVMVADHSDRAALVRALDLGAEDVLSLPLDPELLLARVRNGLERRRMQRIEKHHLELLEGYARTVDSELDAARRMQSQFLPTDVGGAPGWRCEVFFRPAKQVAGDFYDSFALSDGSVVLVMGDVCGKGFGAAFFMALTRSLIRLFVHEAHKTGSDPFDAIRRTSDYIAVHHDELSMFATAFMLLLEPESDRLRYANAGQDAGLLRARDGSLRAQLQTTGPAVGMLPGLTFETGEVELEVGDSLVLVTDGICEAFDEAGEAFGVDRLHATLGEPARNVREVIDHISEAVDRHSSGVPQSDDITLMAVERLARKDRHEDREELPCH